jgi:microcystin-dependent protein
MKLFLFGLILSNFAFGVCLSPISRTNNTTGQVLTSTKYNLDLNTVYAKVNNLPGDCINDDTIATAKLQDGAVTEDKIAAAVLAKFVPAGVIMPYGGTIAPSGYLLCNGQAVSRVTYADLFAAVGTAFGSGNGSTTFNVPDLRGRFLRGLDGGAGRDPDAASRTAMNSGGNAGDNVGSVQDDQLESHTHNTTMYNEVNDSGDYAATTDSTGSPTDIVTSATGGNETRPKNANVNFIIKI